MAKDVPVLVGSRIRDIRKKRRISQDRLKPFLIKRATLRRQGDAHGLYADSGSMEQFTSSPWVWR